MLRSQAALCWFTGSFDMSVFQMLSEGNMGQLGAPGTLVSPPAVTLLALAGSTTASSASGSATVSSRTGTLRHIAVMALILPRWPGSPPVDVLDELGQPGDHRIRHGVVGRHVAVPHEHRPHSDALGPVHVVIGPVADEHARGGVVLANGGHRGPE